MQKINRCFILENGEYIEVPAERVLDNGEYREEFKSRYFFPFDDILLEMSKKDRRYFFACQEAMKDIIKQPKRQVKRGKKFLVLSIDELVDDTGEGNQHLDFFQDVNTDIAGQVEHRIILEAIKDYRKYLSPAENQLLKDYYEEGLSDRALAIKYNVDHSTITKRRKRILATLLNLFEN